VVTKCKANLAISVRNLQGANGWGWLLFNFQTLKDFVYAQPASVSFLLGVFAGGGLALLAKPSTKRQFETHLNSADGESVRS
jgi:hypothetical protein